MNFVESGWLVFLKADLWFLVFTASFFVVGQAVLGRGFFETSRPSSRAMSFIFSTACGLFIFSLWVYFSAYFHFLSPPSLAAFPLLALGLFFWQKRPWLEICFPRPSGLFEWAALLAAMCLAALTFVACHAPEFGNDSLAYHLYFPKLYAETGGLVHIPSHPRSLWPSMMGMLFSAGLRVQGVALAKLFSWLSAMLAIFAPVAAAHYFSGQRSRGVTAWVFIITIPALWMQSFYAYTDHAMMLFSWLLFVSLWHWREHGYAARQAVVAGLFAAALLSVKYYTFVIFAILGVGTLGWGIADSVRGKRVPMKSFFIFAVTTLGFCGFWFVRSWALTGNPVFPFAEDLFDGNGFRQRMVGFAVLGRDWKHLLALPWNLAAKPKVFGGEPLGLISLAILPFLFYWKKIDKFAKYSLGVAAIYILVWFYTIQHARFIFPAIPFLVYGGAALIACGFAALDGPFKKTLQFIFLFVAASQIAIGIYYPVKIIPAATGIIPAGVYLKNHEHSFAIYQKISPYLKKEDTLLSILEPRLFYSPCRVLFYNPTIKWLCRREGLTFPEWLKHEGVAYLLSVSRKASTLKKDPSESELLTYAKVMERSSSVDEVRRQRTADPSSEENVPLLLRYPIATQLVTEGSVDAEGSQFFYELRKVRQ